MGPDLVVVDLRSNRRRTVPARTAPRRCACGLLQRGACATVTSVPAWVSSIDALRQIPSRPHHADSW